MAVQANGHLVKDQQALDPLRHHRVLKPRARRPSLWGRGANIVARLFFWYSILTIFFRCPSTHVELNESSPKICSSYLTTRSYISPRLEPYYETYAAPYVNAVRPYGAALDSKILAPASNLSRRTYKNYGASHVDQVRQYGHKEWRRTVRPRIERVMESTGKQYNATLAPHVNRAFEVGSPYYSFARDNLLQTYYAHLLPAFTISLPYVQHAYSIGHAFVLETAFPYVQSAFNATTALIGRTIWPRIRILYGENVEPQLLRIGERLGRCRIDRKSVV